MTKLFCDLCGKEMKKGHLLKITRDIIDKEVLPAFSEMGAHKIVSYEICTECCDRIERMFEHEPNS